MPEKIPQTRKEINKFSPYVPGRSIEEVKDEFGIDDITKLASNENLWGCSAAAIEAIRGELDTVHYYPQSSPGSLISKIARKNDVPPESVILGNGTDEIIELIAKTYLSGDDSMVVSENSFVRYKMAGMLMGSRVVEVPRKGLETDLGGIIGAIDRTVKVVFLDNPCNPTGRCVRRSDMDHFLSNIEMMQEPPLVVIDEAYFEYVRDRKYSSFLVQMKRNIPIMILRTFSKIYGLAGLRIGYGISRHGIISDMNRIRPPFNTNRLAQTAAAAAIEDDGFIARVAEKTAKEKEYLYAQFDELGLEYVRSQTNFILVGFPAGITDELCGHLMSRGIILRPLSGYSIKDHIRITVGKREHNSRLVDELARYLDNSGEKK